MNHIIDIAAYLRAFGNELADRTVQMHPALYNPGDPVSPRMNTLLRKPYPAQDVRRKTLGASSCCWRKLSRVR